MERLPDLTSKVWTKEDFEHEKFAPPKIPETLAGRLGLTGWSSVGDLKATIRVLDHAAEKVIAEQKATLSPDNLTAYKQACNNLKANLQTHNLMMKEWGDVATGNHDAEIAKVQTHIDMLARFEASLQMSKQEKADQAAGIVLDYLLADPELLNQEGVFRLSGSKKTVDDVEARLEMGKDVDLTKLDADTLAGVLKLALRSRERALIPSNYKELKDVPGADGELLKKVIRIMKAVAGHKKTKMNYNTLAIATAPSLFGQTSDATAIQRQIALAEKIFGTEL